MWLTVNPPLLPRLWNTPSTLLHPRDLHPQTIFCCFSVLLCVKPGCHWAGGCISELCHSALEVGAFKHRTARENCHLILASSFHLLVSWTPFWELGAVSRVSRESSCVRMAAWRCCIPALQPGWLHVLLQVPVTAFIPQCTAGQAEQFLPGMWAELQGCSRLI